MKKLISILLCCLFTFALVGCGSTKLEDKQEIANYADMKNGKFNAKYTNLDNVKISKFYNDKNYPNKGAMQVKDESNNGYFNIIVQDSSGEIKTKFGNKVLVSDKINIVKAEVDSDSLNNKEKEPTLIVKTSDIELIDEKNFQIMLESNKSFSELNSEESNFLLYMLKVEDSNFKYDDKYSDRVKRLIQEHKENLKNIQVDIKTDNTDKVPHTVTSSYKAKFGQILEAKQLGNTLTIKFKITPSATKKLTIDQNGFNVEDLITSQGCDKFDKISYWAVSDMTDGTESKVISYTLNKDLIQKIKNKQIFGQQISSVADDVWILPSLKN